MLTLGIETSTKTGSICVLKDRDLLCETVSNINLTFSERFFELLESTLKNARTSIEDIDLVAVDTGPGSFTGLRIAVASMKGLLSNSKIPVAQVSSLKAMACNFVSSLHCTVIPVMDARMNSLYISAFNISNGTLERLTEDQNIPVENLPSFVETYAQTQATPLIIASSMKTLELEEQIIERSPQFTTPRALNVALSGLDLYEAGKHGFIHQVLPRYYKASAAETKKGITV